MGVAARPSGTVSPFRAEQGTSLETPRRARALSCQELGTTWFSRVAAGFSSYDGDLSLPLGLALGPTPTPAAAPRSGVLARTRVVSPEGCHVRAARHYPRHPRRVEGREGASAGCDVAQLPFPASLSGPPWRRPRDVVGGSPFSFLHAAAAARCAPGGQRLRGNPEIPAFPGEEH